MTVNQEDALYEFLENTIEPFALEEVVTFIRMVEPKRIGRLADEVTSFIDARNMAFRQGPGRWVSRRGCFEPAPFVITPTRVELLNGILIPGHRCLPFANPVLLPQELRFFWQGAPVPVTTTEGPPEDFYPYYSIYGEEYAPQYVARDNPENESAFNADPYEDPPEVSIRTLDMRNLYRECGFVPGDRFVARTLDWKEGHFALERVSKEAWREEDLKEWAEAAEQGFEDSFSLLGPGASTEEQIAYAYWYGGKRIRTVPAYSLEDFLYEKTDRIETAAYGIETRFWYTGREIPDTGELEGAQIRPDKTLIEEILYREHIPVSEYVIQAYIRDALFRKDPEVMHIFRRLVPPALEMNDHDRALLAGYIAEVLREFEESYSLFSDKSMGPIRQRVGELHTAVIELAARLGKGDIDPAWLPKHTFVILSQIQSHAAGVLEDLDTGEAPPDEELEAIDNSLDSMIETYEDIKELIDEALDSFRRNKLSVVKGNSPGVTGRLVQVSIGGINVWRRVLLPETMNLEELHRVVQGAFGWKDTLNHRFRIEKMEAVPSLSLKEMGKEDLMELSYEYGTKWTIKIILLSRYEGESGERVRCVAGAGAAPPEQIEGPLRYRKFLLALERGNEAERQGAERELGAGFDPNYFDLEECSRLLHAWISGKKPQGGPVIIDF
jgi:hypothetical protein